MSSDLLDVAERLKRVFDGAERGDEAGLLREWLPLARARLERGGEGHFVRPFRSVLARVEKAVEVGGPLSFDLVDRIVRVSREAAKG